MDITIEIAVKEFEDKLKQKLQIENFDLTKITHYVNALHSAKEFCIEQFNGEFGRFGGQFTSHGPDHAARVLSYATLISERLTPLINATEFFFLGLSALLHDIGMTAPLPLEFIQKVMDEDQRWNERRKRHGEATLETLLQFAVHIPEHTHPL